ncbi:tRNA (adenosine(37)-N6)-threonylcarbamoyltransferase complex ATPase subunit type 1 TsaE [Candidatus Absconditicoccus praedator]|uniref:tRNA (adenosine(37)-N6)-threonylcarbamoyltransferase complex ATPase subunit type 1 TsaE n=1 Tax=Candidatus Absconditicoccus praedator TaxID=2735562 RepID=UPI001E298139|nr:tRNA (adenosine(37)-N6)-threonylcarbamoyltransferase complex ATPase subunit type 1 TsaE [Candidatus Absconditicoccus praedator]UFX83148.1 tRNA (adenosine(37)-N6)-threonylcarbamoyltransferase complex ATPase subunit type 1 TsaE [Candidatus Absconditicoccus praedator]
MIINSPNEMKEKAHQIIQKKSKILLNGQLGAGKTQFVKGVANFLKIDESKIQSPTYSYMHEYEETLLHIDMYRLETPEDMIQKGILEKIEEYKWICIEWPKFQEYYQDNEFLSIDIRKLENEKRELIY